MGNPPRDPFTDEPANDQKPTRGALNEDLEEALALAVDAEAIAILVQFYLEQGDDDVRRPVLYAAVRAIRRTTGECIHRLSTFLDEAHDSASPTT